MTIKVFLILLFSNMAFAQQNSGYQKRELSLHGDTLKYNIHFPDNYSPKKKYPVITFLHGSGEKGNDNESQLKHGGDFFIKPVNAKALEAIVIFPQCPENSSWRPMVVHTDSTHKNTFDLTFNKNALKPTLLLKYLLDSLQSKNIADPKRMYIGGLSLGGFGTFDMLERYPDYFCAAFPICGGGDVSMAPVFAGKVALWIFHGEQDAVVSAELSREYYKKLKALNADVKYTEYAGVGHTSWDNVFKENSLIPWLASHKKK